MDLSLVMVVLGVNWVVALIDLVLEWRIEVILVCVVLVKHDWMGWLSRMSVLELGVVMSLLWVLVMARCALVVCEDSAAFVVRFNCLVFFTGLVVSVNHVLNQVV